MKTEKVIRSHDMVDSLGYVRHVTVTIESDPGIRVVALLKGYYDEYPRGGSTLQIATTREMSKGR